MLDQNATPDQVRAALQTSANNTDKSPIKKLPATVKDTAFFAAGEQLTNVTLFNGDKTKDVQYIDKQFPSNSQKFVFYGISASTSIAFNGATEEFQAAQMQHFLEESYLDIKIEGDEATKLYLKDLVPSIVVNQPSTDVTTLPHLGIKHKENNVFPFPVPIEIGAGENMEIEFVPAKGLTTAADSASVGFDLPNAGLTNDRGHAVRFYLHAFKFKSAMR